MSVGASMPPRLAAVVVPVYLTGIVVTLAAAASFATSPRGAAALVGVAGLLAASTFSERYPVPLDGIDTGGVSLTFVFAVATIVLYGWQAGVIVGFAAPVMQLIEHRPPIRVAYNASVLAAAGAASGAVMMPLHGSSATLIVLQVAAVAFVHYSVNVMLVSLVVGASARKSVARVAYSSFSITILPFALMASAALILVVLWQRSPALSGALVGPLLAIAL
jgi:hypothetical protein